MRGGHNKESRSRHGYIAFSNYIVHACSFIPKIQNANLIAIIIRIKIKTITQTHPKINQRILQPTSPSGGALPRICCIHVRSGPIYLGGYLPCKKDNKVMVFYM